MQSQVNLAARAKLCCVASALSRSLVPLLNNVIIGGDTLVNWEELVEKVGRGGREHKEEKRAQGEEREGNETETEKANKEGKRRNRMILNFGPCP